MEKLYIVLVGLPARGKSTVGVRLLEGLTAEGLRVRIFNNGDLRRSRLGEESSRPEFYHPANLAGRRQREQLALSNAAAARLFLEKGGHVAILDATNASRKRRDMLERTLTNAPVLYIECVNDDPDLLAASVQRKARLPEFCHLSPEDAVRSFTERMEYYERIYAPLDRESCHIRVDTLQNRILEENFSHTLPHYIHIRDILVSDWVRRLHLARHGESLFNVQGRIGGDSGLTERGKAQAGALAAHFHQEHIPYVFTSPRRRSCETAEPVLASHPEAVAVSIAEFDEIDAGICDGMSYSDIRRDMPEEFAARRHDKYAYTYPRGEGYASMRARVERGVRKVLFLSGGQPGTLIIGHQAVNRLILSLFLLRRTEDVPYSYVPQNQYYLIVATHQKKLFELVPFMAAGPEC